MQLAENGVVYGVVFFPIVILGPAIELPIGRGDDSAIIHDKNGPKITNPPAVGGRDEEIDGSQVYAAAVQDFSRTISSGGIIDDDAHPLNAGEVTDNVGVDPRNRLEFAGPIGEFVRPGEPRRDLRLPFGRHSEALVMRTRTQQEGFSRFQSSHLFRMGA